LHVVVFDALLSKNAAVKIAGLGIQNHDFEAFPEAWALLERQRLGTTRSPLFDE